MSSEETRFRRLVDVLDHAVVWEFDDDAQRYTFVSAHSMLVLGYPREEWLTDPAFFERRVFSDDREKLAEMLSKLRSGEATDLRLEHRCAKADGAMVWVHTGVHIEREAGGRTLLRGVTIDINNVKAAEERERVAREQAEEAMRAYEELMAIVSHDLRSPLNAILLGAAALDQDPGRAKKVAASTRRSAEQMARLIEDLMDLSSIRSRRLTVTATEVMTRDLLREVGEAFAAQAAEQGVDLVIGEGDATVLRCDPKRVAQVLANIVGNALKFTKRTVTVGVSLDELEARFSVRDDGVGIASEDLERVFERNWQARETASRGNGLGLFIARGIVHAHAGRIWVESVLGEGSTFHFTLPRA